MMDSSFLVMLLSLNLSLFMSSCILVQTVIVRYLTIIDIIQHPCVVFLHVLLLKIFS
jgi:hypothetical protein